MRELVAFLSFIAIALAADLKKDLEQIERLRKELSNLERDFKEKGIELKKVDKLNSIGYPIHILYERYKYLKNKDKRYEEIYKKAKALQERYFLIKRELFPYFVMQDAKRNKLNVCSVEVKGKEKKKIVVRIEHPEKDEEIRKVYESTQLYYADRLGFEVIDFQKCKD